MRCIYRPYTAFTKSELNEALLHSTNEAMLDEALQVGVRNAIQPSVGNQHKRGPRSLSCKEKEGRRRKEVFQPLKPDLANHITAAATSPIRAVGQIMTGAMSDFATS
jgi:hypothetical protein